MAGIFALDYLADPECTSTKGALCVEYRLLCSGTIYCDIIGDWTKSEIARFLLSPPLLLFAASRPFQEWPLELILRLKVSEVTETKQIGTGTHAITFYPDAEGSARYSGPVDHTLCRRLDYRRWQIRVNYIPITRTMHFVICPCRLLHPCVRCIGSLTSGHCTLPHGVGRKS